MLEEAGEGGELEEGPFLMLVIIDLEATKENPTTTKANFAMRNTTKKADLHKKK